MKNEVTRVERQAFDYSFWTVMHEDMCVSSMELTIYGDVQ